MLSLDALLLDWEGHTFVQASDRFERGKPLPVRLVADMREIYSAARTTSTQSDH